MAECHRTCNDMWSWCHYHVVPSLYMNHENVVCIMTCVWSQLFIPIYDYDGEKRKREQYGITQFLCNPPAPPSPHPASVLFLSPALYWILSGIQKPFKCHRTCLMDKYSKAGFSWNNLSMCICTANYTIIYRHSDSSKNEFRPQKMLLQSVVMAGSRHVRQKIGFITCGYQISSELCVISNARRVQFSEVWSGCTAIYGVRLWTETRCSRRGLDWRQQTSVYRALCAVQATALLW